MSSFTIPQEFAVIAVNATIRDDLLSKLAVLSLYYPAMRIGQLLGFACAIAANQAPATVEDATDEATCQAIQQHLHKRFGVGDMERGNGVAKLTETRAQLFDALKELGQRHPNASTGQLLTTLAALAKVNVYDIEDEQLLDTAGLAKMYERAKDLFDPAETNRIAIAEHGQGVPFEEVMRRLESLG